MHGAVVINDIDYQPELTELLALGVFEAIRLGRDSVSIISSLRSVSENHPGNEVAINRLIEEVKKRARD